MLSSNVEYLSARLYNSSIITGRSKDREERGRWCEASLKVLKDCVHAVNLYLLNGLPEPPGEVPHGFLLLLYNSLQITNISLQPY